MSDIERKYKEIVETIAGGNTDTMDAVVDVLETVRRSEPPRDDHMFGVGFGMARWCHLIEPCDAPVSWQVTQAGVELLIVRDRYMRHYAGVRSETDRMLDAIESSGRGEVRWR